MWKSLTRKFCSRRCYTLKRRAMSNKIFLANPQPKRNCLQCGKVFFEYRRQYLLKHKFCSVQCAKRYAWAHDDGTARQRMRELGRKHRHPHKENTGIEIALQNELRKRGIKFVPHISLIVCQPDIFLPEARLAVFADGCFYHRCLLHCRKPDGKIPLTTMKRDQYQTAYLLRHGYKVMRFWEHDINRDVVACVDQIANLINGNENNTAKEVELSQVR